MKKSPLSQESNWHPHVPNSSSSPCLSPPLSHFLCNETGIPPKRIGLEGFCQICESQAASHIDWFRLGARLYKSAWLPQEISDWNALLGPEVIIEDGLLVPTFLLTAVPFTFEKRTDRWHVQCNVSLTSSALQAIAQVWEGGWKYLARTLDWPHPELDFQLDVSGLGLSVRPLPSRTSLAPSARALFQQALTRLFSDPETIRLVAPLPLPGGQFQKQFLHELTKVSKKNQDQAKIEISQELLSIIGQSFEADRVAIFRYQAENDFLEFSHFWSHDPTDKVMIEDTTGSSFMPFVIDNIQKNGYLILLDATQIKGLSVKEREMIEARKAGALLAVPLQNRDQVLGYLFVVSHKPYPDWNHHTIQNLQDVAFILANLIFRNEINRNLEEIEARVQMAIEGSGAGIWEITSRSSIPKLEDAQVYLSPQLKKILYWEDAPDFASLEDCIQRTLEEDREGLFKDLMALVGGETDFWESEFRLRSPEGQIGWIYARGKLMRDHKGRPAKVTGFVWDITSRKRAEVALRDSEEYYRTLVEDSFDGICLMDPKGVILYFNSALTPILGYEPKDLIGDTLLEIFHPQDRQKGVETFRQVLAQPEKPVLAQLRYRTRNGEIRILESRSLNLLQNRAVQGIINHFQDITARFEVQQERERLIAELEAKNSALEQFAYTVSHDLKSPLITIQGYSNHIVQDIERANYTRIKQDVQRIVRAIGTMSSLLEELLKLSRIGHLVSLEEEFSLSTPLEEALILLEGHPSFTRMDFQIQSNLYSIRGDKQRMVEVWQNLLENAMKFMGEQAHPRVEIGMEPVNYRGQTILSCFVKDNGIGIDPEHQQKVFQLFERLEPRYPGNGIGLTVVKRIIELHNGKIWIESLGNGHGTTFFFAIPLTP